MDNITYRQKLIVQLLEQLGGEASGKTIADSIQISLRTVQKEMSILKKNNIVISNGNGYKLVRNDSRIISTVKEPNEIQFILRKLLSNNNSINIYDLSDELYLSESTLKSRFSSLKEVIAPFNLKIKVNNDRLFLDGAELSKRRLFRNLIYSEISNSTDDCSKYKKFFPKINIDTLINIIISSLNGAGYYVQSPYSTGLILGVSIGLYRIYEGVHTPKFFAKYGDEKIEFKLAKTICDRFFDHYGKKATNDDIGYIAELFEGQIYAQNKDNSFKIDAEFEEKINSILTETLESFLIASDTSTYIHNLSLHVNELIKRCEIDNFIVNDSNVSIKENAPFIYDVAVKFAISLEKAFQIMIPDTEIAFLAIHIGIIIEQSQSNKNTVQILLVCSNYHNLADQIQKRITDSFGNQVSIEIQDPEVQFKNNRAYDLIIATHHMEIIGGNKIEISPFYSILDRSVVNEAINSCVRQKLVQRNNRHILECFSPDLFFINPTINTKAKAINFLSGKLIDFGIVNENYTESVFQRESLSPTCFFDSFAVPHSIEMDANKTMIAVLLNTDGIKWDDSNIKLCLMIAIAKNDRKTFSETYNGAVQALMDKNRFLSLISAKDFSEFIANFKVT